MHCQYHHRHPDLCQQPQSWRAALAHWGAGPHKGLPLELIQNVFKLDHVAPSPRALPLPGRVSAPPPGTAVLESEFEHGGHLAACGGLGNEAGGGKEEDEEGQAHAAHDDAVAQQEADVLLDKGQHQQRQHGTHVNAPIKPVEEAAVGMAAKIHHLPGKGESEAQGGVRAPCRVPAPPFPQRHFLDQWVGVLALSSP